MVAKQHTLFPFHLTGETRQTTCLRFYALLLSLVSTAGSDHIFDL